MSDPHDPQQSPNPTPPGAEPPPMVIPVRYPLPPAPPSHRPASGGSVFASLVRGFLGMVMAISLGLNFILLIMLFLGGFGGMGDESGGSLRERVLSLTGESPAKEKIAVIRVDGVIMEGQMAFANKQIEAAATDPEVKGVVLRINSPGGSITASDDLHRRLKELADGKCYKQKPGPKPIVVSMAALAASGGYYIAMPSQYVMAERTTITGSIGVYAAFPDITGLSQKVGVTLRVIKAGDMKDSGSMFHTMTAQERYLWQNMVSNAYDQFLDVVKDGRKLPKELLTEKFDVKEIPDVDAEGKPLPVPDGGKPVMVRFARYRADGGIYTAQEALKLGLIDAIGYQDDAIREAAKRAKLEGITYKVIQYEKPAGLASLLLGAKTEPPEDRFDLGKLSSGTTPRLWYLAPQSELAGILSSMGQK